MDIDFVVLWVDGNDPEWQEKRDKYRGVAGDKSTMRFRDWGLLKYWFRSVEKNAPWVHKIYFVTCGHYPKWLNLEHPKLEFVKHEDFIPNEWLPTFSSRTIDLNLHRIKGLSEHFVYFNDDMYIVNRLTPEFFFKKGLPRASALMKVRPYYNIDREHPLWFAPLFCLKVINDNFDKRKTILCHLNKWFSPCYGRNNLVNLLLLPFKEFTGFKGYHLPDAFLKSTYEEVWKAEGEILSEVSSHRFRVPTELNQYVLRYWQFVTGKFIPRSDKVGYNLPIKRENTMAIHKALNDPKTKMICLNDDDDQSEDFEEMREFVNKELLGIFPEKSSFELD